MNRCNWVPPNDELYCHYHDFEWGVPLLDDQKLFELLTLEGAQAGLSWKTVLNKRNNYIKAFDNFDFNKISNYDEKKIQLLLMNEGIIRNRLKIRSTINNSQCFLKIIEKHGSFSNFIWDYVNNKPLNNKWSKTDEIPTKTELSDRISKDLKKLGFKFTGSTIIYSFLQACGLVNDHTVSCYRYSEIIEIQKSIF